MLVLGRKTGESVVVEHGGKPVGKILITAARDGSVRLGFEFDRQYTIYRDELAGFRPAPDAECVSA